MALKYHPDKNRNDPEATEKVRCLFLCVLHFAVSFSRKSFPMIDFAQGHDLFNWRVTEKYVWLKNAFILKLLLLQVYLICFIGVFSFQSKMYDETYNSFVTTVNAKVVHHMPDKELNLPMFL